MCVGPRDAIGHCHHTCSSLNMASVAPPITQALRVNLAAFFLRASGSKFLLSGRLRISAVIPISSLQPVDGVTPRL